MSGSPNKSFDPNPVQLIMIFSVSIAGVRRGCCGLKFLDPEGNAGPDQVVVNLL
jgi:hypothetical protein